MNTFHLVPEGNRWKLTGAPGETIEIFATKEAAVRACAAFMKDRVGSLRIHRADGTLEEERTYPRSEDPAKSPG